ncbi:MAG: hypothetical protein R3A12_14195 [Ignavibacteria bacterium]
MDNKSKTDKFNASALAQFGLEKQLKAWTPPCDNERYKNLQNITT